jgi:hypothetical protein
MPQKLWCRLIIIACVYAFGSEVVWSYERLETIARIPEGAWFAGVMGSWVLVNGALFWHALRAGKGAVTAAGLERENGLAIPLSSVERIVREGRGFPAVVFVADTQVKMYLQDRYFIKLAATRLNKWTINNDEIIVIHGEAEQKLQISYAPLGMYGNFIDLSKWLILFSLMAKVLSETFSGYVSLLFYVSLICIMLLWVLSHYRRVRVAVDGDRVVLKNGKKEESFRFGDVVAMEKGLFQVKATAKDGKIFFFPRGCLLLPEIIEEFAGLAGR